MESQCTVELTMIPWLTFEECTTNSRLGYARPVTFWKVPWAKKQIVVILADDVKLDYIVLSLTLVKVLERHTGSEESASVIENGL